MDNMISLVLLLLSHQIGGVVIRTIPGYVF